MDGWLMSGWVGGLGGWMSRGDSGNAQDVITRRFRCVCSEAGAPSEKRSPVKRERCRSHGSASSSCSSKASSESPERKLHTWTFCSGGFEISQMKKIPPFHLELEREGLL